MINSSGGSRVGQSALKRPPPPPPTWQIFSHCILWYPCVNKPSLSWQCDHSGVVQGVCCLPCLIFRPEACGTRSQIFQESEVDYLRSRPAPQVRLVEASGFKLRVGWRKARRLGFKACRIWVQDSSGVQLQEGFRDEFWSLPRRQVATLSRGLPSSF